MKNLIDRSYINAKNELSRTVNSLIPKIADRLKEGYSLKQDGTLFKKDADALKAIIEPSLHPKGKYMQIYVVSSEYTLRVCIRTRYQTSEETCAYIEHNAYVVSHKGHNSIEPNFIEHVPFEEVTVEQFREAKAQLKDLEDQRQKIASETSKLKHKWDF